MRYLETYQCWILERLKLFGYFDADVEAEPLELRSDEVAEAVDAVLKVFRSKSEDAALLPPISTLPEKLVVLRAIAPKLKEALTKPGVLKG